MKFKKLEALRGFAALYVVANHVVGLDSVKQVIHPLARLPFRFGQEAVMMFFLLSGFVIYLSESRSNAINFPKYLTKRFVRIYPILFASFIISTIAAIINGYHFEWNDLRVLICNIFMMQDLDKPGCTVLPYLNNFPLWTLSYECGFYLLFYPIYIFFIKEKCIKTPTIYIVLAISMAGWLLFMLYPNHLLVVLAYFSLWWTGVACAQIYLEYKTFNFRHLKPVLLSLSVMTLFTSIPFIKAVIYNEYWAPADYPLIVFRHYGMALIIIMLALAWWKIKLKGFDFIFGVFERFAPISYGLYISHFIFVKLEITVVNLYVTLLLKLVLAFVTAYLLEIQLQPVMNRLFLAKYRK